MDTELLKKKILQLAMQGKLVKQDENDGSAEELIDKILEEKKKLMAEGKIKKEKLSRIYKNSTDNHYYEKFEDGEEKTLKDVMALPDKWQYIKMNNVIFYEQPSKYIVESANYNDKYSTPVLTAGKSFILGYTNETKGIFSKVPVIIFDDFTTESKYVDFDFKVKSSALKILNCSHFVNIKFIYYLLQVINVDVSTHKRHWLSNYEYMIIPIPSKQEQDRIVTKIEELFKKVESIHEHYRRINKLKELLKSKIIDMAIKGNLTKQLPTDTSASKLIENVLEEKRKLIKEGKIKKENLSVIYKDSKDKQFYEKFDNGKIVNITAEIPFDIPENWSWTRLKNIMDVRDGTHDSPKYHSSGIPLLTSKNLSEKGLDLKNVKYISMEDSKKINERSNVDDGDILLAMIGSIGNPVIVKKEFEFSIKNMALLKNIYNINIFYIYYVLQALQTKMKKESGGSVQRFVSLNYLRNFLIPFPSIEEQARIVEKLIKILNT